MMEGINLQSQPRDGAGSDPNLAGAVTTTENCLLTIILNSQIHFDYLNSSIIKILKIAHLLNFI